MRRSLAVAGLTVVLALAACGGSDGSTAGGTTTTGDGSAAADGSTTTLDQSSFCVTIRSLEALGAEPAASAGTPEQVLAQNASMAALLDEAAANAPEDAPEDVQAFLDDYRAISDAVTAAGGDTDAAFTSLSTDEPELVARLNHPDAHAEAFTFFSERCGTAPP